MVESDGENDLGDRKWPAKRKAEETPAHVGGGNIPGREGEVDEVAGDDVLKLGDGKPAILVGGGFPAREEAKGGGPGGFTGHTAPDDAEVVEGKLLGCGIEGEFNTREFPNGLGRVEAACDVVFDSVVAVAQGDIALVGAERVGDLGLEDLACLVPLRLLDGVGALVSSEAFVVEHDVETVLGAEQAAESSRLCLLPLHLVEGVEHLSVALGVVLHQLEGRGDARQGLHADGGEQ